MTHAVSQLEVKKKKKKKIRFFTDTLYAIEIYTIHTWCKVQLHV